MPLPPWRGRRIGEGLESAKRSTFVVAVPTGVTALIPMAADMDANTRALSRVSPRLVDFAIALTASFVAALASLRRDIPDTLPGVAISASIAPPLCVVGAGLYEGAPSAARGEAGGVLPGKGEKGRATLSLTGD